jgi:hypothetical protein
MDLTDRSINTVTVTRKYLCGCNYGISIKLQCAITTFIDFIAR